MEDSCDLQLCDCCMIWRENRDRSGCEFYCTPADHPRGLCGELDPFTYVAAATDRDGDFIRDDFSRVTCDGCGSPLAGARNTYVGTIQ